MRFRRRRGALRSKIPHLSGDVVCVVSGGNVDMDVIHPHRRPGRTDSSCVSIGACRRGSQVVCGHRRQVNDSLRSRSRREPARVTRRIAPFGKCGGACRGPHAPSESWPRRGSTQSGAIVRRAAARARKAASTRARNTASDSPPGGVTPRASGGCVRLVVLRPFQAPSRRSRRPGSVRTSRPNRTFRSSAVSMVRDRGETRIRLGVTPSRCKVRSALRA